VSQWVNKTIHKGTPGGIERQVWGEYDRKLILREGELRNQTKGRREPPRIPGEMLGMMPG